MAVAVLQGEDTVVAYFPSGTWYSLTGHPMVDAPEKGETLELDMPLGVVGVHVLGGSIVPMQACPPYNISLSDVSGAYRVNNCCVSLPAR